jgi:hypothetical protein
MIVNANFEKEKNVNRWFIDFGSENQYPGNESDFNALAKFLSTPVPPSQTMSAEQGRMFAFWSITVRIV